MQIACNRSLALELPTFVIHFYSETQCVGIQPNSK